MKNQPIYITNLLSDSLNALCTIVNDWAETKGWNEGEDSVQRKSSDIALMHSELSECLEFIRTKVICPHCGGKDTELFEDRGVNSLWACQGDCLIVGTGNTFVALNSVPDDHVPSLSGESAELADVLIRIFHYCGRRNINLGEAVRLKHEYNLSRPYKHGKNL